jgi:hypothetical protein
MNIVRSEDLSAHTQGRALRIDLRRAPILLVCALLVFALLFELGHLTRSTHALAQTSDGQRALPAEFARAGIPDGLNAATPIPSIVALKAHKSQPQPASQPVVAAAPPAPAESAKSAPVASPVPSSPAPVVPVAPAPVAPAPVHTPAPAASKPSSEPSGGGGGSFDSSE